ncbi:MULTISPECIES: TrbG/VirB9 family P-type conjugative transfer protein [unclassified Phenylobacterium]|uniref:TrbG/VirB9 family P-type conjugative transfer protein n=1 Tax=unclassified Phenylobacterium TaxID=2640670 RepID=UPI00083A3391|nr:MULTISPECIES: TrbG/VirB9 family P-type conjugative transfer protein [unclassified Phenylobacterium]
MDPRRLLILPLVALALGGCAELARLGVTTAGSKPLPAMAAEPEPATATQAETAVAPPAQPFFPSPAVSAMVPIPNPPARHRSAAAMREQAAPQGRAAIAAANVEARETSRAKAFLGGVQVFDYEPGRIYEVWTAPLRVTTLSLSPGESVISKAAGDTVRWQIGETESGEGPTRRAHVMIKPLERNLETNLVLATSRRIYLLQLRSGAADAFNPVVTWDLAALLAQGARAPQAPPPSAEAALVTPQGALDAGYRIRPKGRPPVWTPTAVMTDGVRTFLTFPPAVGSAEAPALFVLSPSGERQLVNYRQQRGLWVVDRVLEAAELRVGGRKGQVVRIERSGGAS